MTEQTPQQDVTTATKQAVATWRAQLDADKKAAHSKINHMSSQLEVGTASEQISQLLEHSSKWIGNRVVSEVLGSKEPYSKEPVDILRVLSGADASQTSFAAREKSSKIMDDSVKAFKREFPKKWEMLEENAKISSRRGALQKVLGAGMAASGVSAGLTSGIVFEDTFLDNKTIARASLAGMTVSGSTLYLFEHINEKAVQNTIISGAEESASKALNANLSRDVGHTR